MAQSVSHYLADWDRFREMWREEENPADALEGAEVCRGRDDYWSTVVRMRDAWARFKRQSAAAAQPLDGLVRAFCGHYEQPFRDLDDAFAYEDGGFTTVIEPGRVARLVEGWKALRSEELAALLREHLGPAEAGELVGFLAERATFLERAAATGKAYVARVG